MRVRASQSQDALALAAGVDRTYVGKLERAAENPSVLILEKLANALEVHVSAFFEVPNSDENIPKPLKAGRKPGKAQKPPH